MKKLLTFIGAISLSSTSISSVVACGETKNYNNVTTDQETKALENFANQNNIQTKDIALNTMTFTNSKQKNNKQPINWNFHLNKNSTLQNKTQLLPTYKGTMIYHTDTQIFDLVNTPTNPFKNLILIPGIYNPSLGVTSAISGYYTSPTDNDFTIAIGSDDLKIFSDAITDEISTSEIFKILKWDTPNEIKLGANIPYSLLKTLEDTPEAWQVPQNYMAVIHVKNNQIVWTNLTTDQAKTSLNETGPNEISSLIIKHSPSQLNLLISHQLAAEIIQVYQLDPINDNPFFETLSLTQWLKNNPNDVKSPNNGNLQVATTTYEKYKDYNATLDEGIKAIQNLTDGNNWGSFSNLVLQLHKNANAYSLIFNKVKNEWIYQNNKSGVYPS